MEWYWWLLITAGIVALGYLKTRIWKNIREKRKQRHNETEE